MHTLPPEEYYLLDAEYTHAIYVECGLDVTLLVKFLYRQEIQFAVDGFKDKNGHIFCAFKFKEEWQKNLVLSNGFPNFDFDLNKNSGYSKQGIFNYKRVEGLRYNDIDTPFVVKF
jgi:hypothetical protein